MLTMLLQDKGMLNTHHTAIDQMPSKVYQHLREGVDRAYMLPPGRSHLDYLSDELGLLFFTQDSSISVTLEPRLFTSVGSILASRAPS
jgi:hypothetical protein